jgi:hypothetical protein
MIKQKLISLDRWKEISESILYILEREYHVDDYEASEIMSALANKENELLSLKLSDASLEIFKRASHLDATHIGKDSNNPSFYIQLDGMDFCLNIESKRWEKCDWDSVNMDNNEIYTKIKFG